MAARSFLGAGDVYIERFVAGVSQGLVGPYYANKFEIKPNVDKKEATSKGRNTYGQVIETVNIQKPADFTLELKEVNKESLTLGGQASIAQTAGSMTAVTFVAKLDQWVDTGKRQLGAVLTLTNTGATVTYVENTDYVVNRPMGWIMALAGGAITDAASVNVSGAYAGATGRKIKGSTRTEVRAEIIFDGINQADGTQCTVKVWEAVLSADSAFDFLADDFGNVSLTGNLKTPVGTDAPYEVDVQNPVA